MKPSLFLFLFCMAVFAYAFSGYGLSDLHFNVLFIFSKEPLPDFWGLHALDPVTNQIDFSFLYRNEGLMAMMFALLHRLPMSVEDKIVFHNVFNLGLQLINIGLFTYVMRKVVGTSRLFPYVFVYVLYPFAASNHYWQANLNVTCAAALFLISLALFLNVEYELGKVGRNFLWIIPSLVFLWLSIIMTEYAIVLSPIYVALSLYYSNHRKGVFRFDRFLTPHTMAASLFLITSIMPILVFSGHRLTVMGYAARFTELAGQIHLPASLITLLVTVGNGLLVFLSFIFANTIGLLVYPIAGLIAHAEYLKVLPSGILAAVGLIAVLGGFTAWLYVRQSKPLSQGATAADNRFLLVLSALWIFLAYFPFMLSIGYPRNVGLLVDRINVLGSMGVAIFLGALFWEVRDRVLGQNPRAAVGYAAVAGLLAMVLALNLQIQKAYYVEAERKERGLVEAVLHENERLLAEGRKPIFLLERASRQVFPFVQLRQALSDTTVWGKIKRVSRFVIQRHFTGVNSSTNLHFNEIYFFWCCPFSAPVTFNFFADREGRPRPIVYKLEEPFRLTEIPEQYRIGYANTEIWNDPAHPGDFQSYSKNTYELVLMEIGESTFKLGGQMVYAFGKYGQEGTTGAMVSKGL